MSNYNTTEDNKIRTVVLNKTDYPYNRTLKKGITIFNESVIAQVFYALLRANQLGIETDHSLSEKDIRTLNVGQVQSMIHIHCKVSRSRQEIIEALQYLKHPIATDVVEIVCHSEIDGDIFDGIKLRYNDTPVDVNELTNSHNTDDLKSELSKVDLSKKKEAPTISQKWWLFKSFPGDTDDKSPLNLVKIPMPPSQKGDQADWKAKAFELYEQHTIDRDTIQSLRAIIIDMSETLHEADPDARISMTSTDLLDLIHSKQDMTDNPF